MDFFNSNFVIAFLFISLFFAILTIISLVYISEIHRKKIWALEQQLVRVDEKFSIVKECFEEIDDFMYDAAEEINGLVDEVEVLDDVIDDLVDNVDEINEYLEKE